MSRNGRDLLILGVTVAQAIAWLLALSGVQRDVSECRLLKWRCHTNVMPSWWSVFFQLFVMVVLLVALATGLDRCRTLVVALLATSTVTTMLEAQKALAMKINEDEYYPSYDKNHIAKLLMGGFITMSIMNIVLMALVGISATPQASSAGGDTCPQQRQEQQERERLVV